MFNNNNLNGNLWVCLSVQARLRRYKRPSWLPIEFIFYSFILPIVMEKKYTYYYLLLCILEGKRI